MAARSVLSSAAICAVVRPLDLGGRQGRPLGLWTELRSDRCRGALTAAVVSARTAAVLSCPMSGLNRRGLRGVREQQPDSTSRHRSGVEVSAAIWSVLRPVRKRW